MTSSRRPLLAKAGLALAVLSGALTLSGCSNSSSPAQTHGLTGSKAYCAKLSAMEGTITAIGLVPASNTATASELVTSKEMLATLSLTASQASGLAPSPATTNDLSNLSLDLARITSNPEYLAAARGDFQAPSDLMTAAQVITQATTDYNTLAHDNRKACPGVKLDGSVLAPAPALG